MPAARKALAVFASAALAAILPASAALAQGDLGTCALPTGCIEAPAPDGVVDAVDEVTEGVSKIVDSTKEATDDTTGGWTAPVTDPIIDGINNTLDLTPTPEQGPGKKKQDKRAAAKGGTVVGSDAYPSAAEHVAAYEHKLNAMAARDASHRFDDRLDRTVSFVPPSEADLAERLAQAALDAVRAFTFPAILIGLVIGFVVVQSRIDHKDPKLALAAVSSEQEYLSFS